MTMVVPQPIPASASTPVAPPVFQLNANHRCDACGARAVHRLTMYDTSEWLFCNHHAKQHGPRLAPDCINWLEETAQLSIRP